MLKWLQRMVFFSNLHISLIYSRSCDYLECGTRKWILILRTKYPTLPHTKWSFWSMWSTNTVPNIEVCQSTNMKACWVAISSPPQWLRDPVNHFLIHIICPVIMKNQQCFKMWLRRHPDEGSLQHSYWPLAGSIWIRQVMHRRTWGKLIQISMITTPIQWGIAGHFGYRI
jgi:hypothetical protein